MKLTATRQRNGVSEGVALGLVMHQKFSLPWDKLGLDLSFESAWRRWGHSWNFPQVRTDLRNGSDGAYVMTRADKQKHTMNLFWERERARVNIWPRGLWSEGEIDYDQAAHYIPGRISAEAWRDLAAMFLERFDP